jgi:hypothetical protein
MSGGAKITGVDFPDDSTRSIVFVASRCDRFWCETGAVIAVCLHLREEPEDSFGLFGDTHGPRTGVLRSGGSFRPILPPEATADHMRQEPTGDKQDRFGREFSKLPLGWCQDSNLGMAELKSNQCTF